MKNSEDGGRRRRREHREDAYNMDNEPLLYKTSLFHKGRSETNNTNEWLILLRHSQGGRKKAPRRNAGLGVFPSDYKNGARDNFIQIDMMLDCILLLGLRRQHVFKSFTNPH